MKKMLLAIAMLAFLCIPDAVKAQSDNPTSPAQPVKLIFIHHSTGENWLTDGYGDLGRTLAENNYFVSDTNYGWGPEAIGDRTDIPNWPEWFASEQTPTFMQAVFTENEQHSSYTRTFGDPGGENTIVMFKSCFPNSELEGSPNDNPDPEGWLSVGHAKYVYNEILPFFASHPEKLFIVVTAPPRSDNTYAANARAFNNWLLNDWLKENNYALSNVAVFDFYNIMTSPDAHHRFTGGRIEHTAAGSNTLAYPSGDDHPSIAGSQKATEEFLPMLNIFYNRWMAGGGQASQPAPAADVPAAAPTAGSADQPAQGTAAAFGDIDTFETANPISGVGWEAFSDEAADNHITCAPSGTQAHGGSQAMQIEYAVASGSWATCDLRFDLVQDWSRADGLTFYMQSSQAGLPYHIDLFTGTPDQVNSFVSIREAPPESANGWAQVTLNWGDFHRVDWEENAGSPLESPSSIVGLAFGFNPPDAAQNGTLWIDDLQLSSGGGAAPAAPAAAASAPTTEPPQPDEAAPTASDSEGKSGGFKLPCASSMALPLAVIGVGWATRKRNLRK
ncbi:MAG: carbohydrate binding domain-containing protein [Anaerolineaceae bacterium]